MDTALTWFIRIWIVIGVALNVVLAGWVMTRDAWKGLEIFKPFSIVNLAAEVLVFSPAILAYIWREKRRAKAAPAHAAPQAVLRRDTPSADRDAKAILRATSRAAERDERPALRGDTRSADRDPKAGLRGDLRSAEPDEQFERLFENFPPKRPI
jgi:hypothetical protein